MNELRVHSILIYAAWALGIFLMASLPPLAHAATNISATSTSHWAWNDAIGWIDFFNTNMITVSSQNLTGYASSSAGDVSLDCHTTSIGSICASSNYQVLNDGSGVLSGWAWNDQYGWISFNCSNNAGCGTSNYSVSIDSAGNFQGFAWNDAVGWIDFNCDNNPPGNTCASSNYYVQTSWVSNSATGTLDSTTFDTGVASGAQLNSVLWQGNLPAGTTVKFQFAVSNASSGPWNYTGSDGTANTYYTPSAPGTSLRLDYSRYNNFRYFRYRVTLVSNTTQTLTPRVDDIIVNWSP